MKRSLRYYAAVYAIAFAVLITASATFVLIQVVHHIQKDSENENARVLADKARSVSQMLRFYRGVAERLARERETLEHALFGNSAEAEKWSASLRRRLPDVIGLALFTTDGRIIGDAPAQRVGPECLLEMAEVAVGNQIPNPPLHRSVPHLAHFDITAPVMNQHRRVGVLFISVSLKALQTSLEGITAHDEMLILRVSDKTRPIKIGSFSETLDAIEEQTAIVGTDWHLGYRTAAPHLREVYLSFASVTAITVIVIAAAIMFLTSHAVQRLGNDLRIIQRKLTKLVRGESPDIPSRVYLKEVEEMLPTLDHIARMIHRRHQALVELSETDDLTGLPNRRALESQFVRYVGLARRGRSVMLGMIDIDRFKEINDQHGHPVGDMVLSRLAEALRQSIRASDMAVRLGGDEFVVLLVDMEINAVRDWFSRLHTCLESLEPPNAIPLKLSLSGGFLQLAHDRSTPLAAALARADHALYDIKKNHRGQCRIVGETADPDESAGSV